MRNGKRSPPSNGQSWCLVLLLSHDWFLILCSCVSFTSLSTFSFMVSYTSWRISGSSDCTSSIVFNLDSTVGTQFFVNGTQPYIWVESIIFLEHINSHQGMVVVVCVGKSRYRWQVISVFLVVLDEMSSILLYYFVFNLGLSVFPEAVHLCEVESDA